MDCRICYPGNFIRKRTCDLEKAKSPQSRIKATYGCHDNNNYSTNVTAGLQRDVIKTASSAFVETTAVALWFVCDNSPVSWFSEYGKHPRETAKDGVDCRFEVNWRSPAKSIAVKPLILNCIHVKQGPVVPRVCGCGNARLSNVTRNIDNEYNAPDLLTPLNGTCPPAKLRFV